MLSVLVAESLLSLMAMQKHELWAISCGKHMMSLTVSDKDQDPPSDELEKEDNPIDKRTEGCD